MEWTEESDVGIVRFVLISSDIIRQRYASCPIKRVYSKYKVTKKKTYMNIKFDEFHQKYENNRVTGCKSTKGEAQKFEVPALSPRNNYVKKIECL